MITPKFVTKKELDRRLSDITSSGDMLKSMYDPENIEDDAFQMDNMVEGTINKILTSVERDKLNGTEEYFTTALKAIYDGYDSEKQDVDTALTEIINLTPSDNDIIQTKSGVWTNRTPAQLKTDFVLVKNDVGLNNVDNIQQIPLTQKGATSGVAELDAIGKVPLDQLSIVGLTYKGTWDADINDPELSDDGGGGISGDIYVVAVAGTTEIDGENVWGIGDRIINQGIVWQKVAFVDLVVSVAGKNGVITLDSDDVGLGDVPNLDTTNAVNNEHTHSNKSILDTIDEDSLLSIKLTVSAVEPDTPTTNDLWIDIS